MTNPGGGLRYCTRGGVISMAELRLLAEAAVSQGDGRIYATGRQEFIVRGVPAARAATLLGRPSVDRLHTTVSPVKNVVSTAPVAGMAGTLDWLTMGVFTELLDRIPRAYPHTVSLADPIQPYLPALCGTINFAACAQRDFWRLHVTDPEGSNNFTLAGAVRSRDLPRVCADISSFLDRHGPPGTDSWARTLDALLEPFRVGVHEPTRDQQFFRMPPGSIVIPFDAEGLPGNFVIDVCLWSATLQHNVQFGLTPWRTLLISGLSDACTTALRRMMLGARVGECTGSWRTFCFDTTFGAGIAGNALRELERAIPMCSGAALCFANDQSFPASAHIVIRPSRARRARLRRERYDILRRDAGGPPASRWTCVKNGVRPGDVAQVIVSALAGVPQDDPSAASNAPETRTAARRLSHECVACLTEYSAHYGDVQAGVKAGTAFENLPESWVCPVCGGPKSHFKEKNAA
ncbi:MAG: rubredoxin domain-containing protein [Candidatus Hydrogenedentes bacterium]|nr:rubredoxin domain-containing protein [Candidatus Hydrogenedentota bacterium]